MCHGPDWGFIFGLIELRATVERLLTSSGLARSESFVALTPAAAAGLLEAEEARSTSSSSSNGSGEAGSAGMAAASESDTEEDTSSDSSSEADERADESEDDDSDDMQKPHKRKAEAAAQQHKQHPLAEPLFRLWGVMRRLQAENAENEAVAEEQQQQRLQKAVQEWRARAQDRHTGGRLGWWLH